MIFAFYSAELGGDEILIDQHTAAGGNPIPVTEGLFSASLGGGVLADGVGPGTYNDLPEVFRVDEDGNLFTKGVVSPASMDVAEIFPIIEPVSAGHVLVASREIEGRYALCRDAADRVVIGVVAAAPGVLLGRSIDRIAAADDELAEQLELARRVGDREAEAALWTALEERFLSSHAAVALTGTVDVKVDAGYGSIEVGDLLTTSPTAGHAMRSNELLPRTILGNALSSLEIGTGTIRMLVTLR
jgi:hypothetical protein